MLSVFDVLLDLRANLRVPTIPLCSVLSNFECVSAPTSATGRKAVFTTINTYIFAVTAKHTMGCHCFFMLFGRLVVDFSEKNICKGCEKQ